MSERLRESVAILSSKPASCNSTKGVRNLTAGHFHALDDVSGRLEPQQDGERRDWLVVQDHSLSEGAQPVLAEILESCQQVEHCPAEGQMLMGNLRGGAVWVYVQLAGVPPLTSPWAAKAYAVAQAVVKIDAAVGAAEEAVCLAAAVLWPLLGYA